MAKRNKPTHFANSLYYPRKLSAVCDSCLWECHGHKVTYDTSQVTCGKCKRSKAFKHAEFDIKYPLFKYLKQKGK